MSKLGTFGYQGKSHDDLLAALLQMHSDEFPTIVADVRRRPTSRRPEWRAEAIAEAVGLLVSYSIYPALGNMGKTATWERPRDSDATETDLATLAALLAQGNPILLLCYEADAAECHRTEVAAEIARLVGIDPEEVIHLD